MAELGEFEIQSEKTRVPIEIEMLEYEYINKCNDPEKLRAIVDVLKSGKEGYYPDLLEKAEQKWLSVLSEKERNRILRMRQQASPMEIHQAGEDLYNWQNEIGQLDAELKSNEKKKSSSKGTLPPVRGTKREKLDGPKKTDTSTSESKGSSQRLSGYDFRAWEKFDVDAAVNAIEEEEKAAEVGKQQSKEKGKKLAEESRLKRLRRYEEDLAKIRTEMNTSGMTDLQRKTLAVREKQKGNEAFKANELNEAFVFYSRSLALDDTIAAVHANRALVSIRLEKLETGEDDATRALELDPNHMKALSRRGLARLKLGKTELAILDFQKALDLKPGNAELEQLLTKAKAKYLEVEGHEYGAALTPPIESSPKEVNLRINSVASAKDMLPNSHTVVSTSGKLQRTENPPKQQFTRIAIEESDEEDDDRKVKNPDSFTRISIQESESGDEEQKIPPNAGSGFTRIAIQMDTDSDEDNVAEEEKEASTNSFTRIPISTESDSEEELPTKKSQEEIEAEALLLKEKGNEYMKCEDYANAIKSYDDCLNLSSNGPHAIAALSNRALAHLQTKNFQAVVSDTSKVLSMSPNNLKVLYRRALAYESLSEITKSQDDIDKILQLDPDNQLALKTKERLQKALSKSPTKPKSLNSSPVKSPSSSNWQVETMKKDALQHLSNGAVTKAIEILQEALQLGVADGDSDQILSVQQLLARAYSSLGNYGRSLEICEEILKSNSNNFLALSRAGDSAFHLDNLEKAREYATRILRTDPINADARVLLDAIEEKENPPLPPKETPPLPTTPPKTSSAPPLPPAKSTPSPSSPSRFSTTSLPTISPETEALSVQKKNEGNDAMKSNDFPRAIKLYTEAIEIDPSNMMFYNNRAQAYIKMNNYSAAEQDSTIVIDSNPRLPNLKALFRRALARKGLNTKESLQNGLHDLNTILSAEPANKEAKLEKGKIQTMLTTILQKEKAQEEERRRREEAEKQRLLPKSERIIDESGITPRSTVIKKNKLPENEITEVVTSPKKSQQLSEMSTLSPPSQGVKSSPLTAASTPQSLPSSTPSKSPASHSKEPKKVSVAAPSVPTEPPKTVYELERVWRGLKNHTSLFGQYLSIFKKSTFKKVIKETISPDLISSMLIAVKNCLLVNNPGAAFTVLEGLSGTNKFEIMLSILPEDDLQCIRGCIDHLIAHVDAERGRKLKEIFGM